MKRLLLILCLLCAFFFMNGKQSQVTGQVPPPSRCIPLWQRWGDVNGDLVTDEKDAIRLQQLIWTGPPSTDDFPYGDLDRSGTIDNTDLLIMQLYLAGRITTLPVTDGSIDASLVTTKFGDCNLDGNVNVTDLNVLANYLAGNISFTVQQKQTCDLDANGIINVTDLNVLANWLAGNIHVLPSP